MQEVAGPFSDFPVDQLWNGREIEIHATVDNLDFETMLAGKETDAGSPVQKIMYHLACHFFGRFADSFVGDPVVGCVYYVNRMTKCRR